MNWDELYGRVKKVAAKTADQINYSTDLAALQVKATVAEQRLERAYSALGKTAYQHFAGEENTAEAVAKAMLRVEDEKRAVLALKRRIAVLKKQRAAELEAQKKAEKLARAHAESISSESKEDLAPTKEPASEPLPDTAEAAEEIDTAMESPEASAEESAPEAQEAPAQENDQ